MNTPKVLMIDSLIGNDYSICLCNALIQNNVDVTFVTAENKKFNEQPKFKVKKWAPSKKNGKNRISKILKYYRYLLRIFMYGIKNPKVIVHYQFFRRRSEAVVILLLKLIKVKVVHTVHNVLPHESNKLDVLRNTWVYKCADELIVHSNYTRDKLLAGFKLNSEKVKVIPHGNFDFYKDLNKSENLNSRTALKLDSYDKVILFFGYIRKYKGLDLLIDAFNIAATKDRNLKLVIAGNPASEELANFYTKKIENSPFRKQIFSHFYFIKKENVSLFFGASDLIVLPYKSIDHSGIVHLAFSFGLPIIATDVGDFREVIEDGRTGYILKENTTANLAKLLSESFSDMKKLKEMGKLSLEVSNSKFSWENIAEKTSELYRSV